MKRRLGGLPVLWLHWKWEKYLASAVMRIADLRPPTRYRIHFYDVVQTNAITCCVKLKASILPNTSVTLIHFAKENKENQSL